MRSLPRALIDWLRHPYLISALAAWSALLAPRLGLNWIGRSFAVVYP
jgi:hypothetical protein